MKHQTVKEVRKVSVARTVSIRGEGTPADPVREVVQFWSFEGKLLAENDPEKELWWKTRLEQEMPF